MRRPHVYERTAPRGSRPAYDEPSGSSVVARTIGEQLAKMNDKASDAGLLKLADLLEAARVQAVQNNGDLSAS